MAGDLLQNGMEIDRTMGGTWTSLRCASAPQNRWFFNREDKLSTIDRVVVYDKPCPCGAGRIVITECSPDHPYAKDSQTSYKSSFTCKDCSKLYEIVDITKGYERVIILNSLADGDSITLKSINRNCRGLTK